MTVEVHGTSNMVHTQYVIQKEKLFIKQAISMFGDNMDGKLPKYSSCIVPVEIAPIIQFDSLYTSLRFSTSVLHSVGFRYVAIISDSDTLKLCTITFPSETSAMIGAGGSVSN